MLKGSKIFAHKGYFRILFLHIVQKPAHHGGCKALYRSGMNQLVLKTIRCTPSAYRLLVILNSPISDVLPTWSPAHRQRS